MCERYNFRRTNILPTESIIDFNARLNTVSKNCNFNNYSRNDAHLDQIIATAPSKLREKLLMEKDINLEKALEIAKHALEGSKWCNQFSLENNKVNINYSKDTNSKFVKNKMPNSCGIKGSKKCYRCGSPRHVANFEKCPASKVTCHKCNKVGHFEKFCLSRSKKSEVHNVNIDDSVSNSSFNVLNLSVNTCVANHKYVNCLLYTSPSPRDKRQSRMPSSA